MPKNQTPEDTSRTRVPQKNEVLGMVEQMFGFDRLRVRCRDGRVRNCRIPGKIRKRMWVREGDVVVVRPWPVQGDERGDIIHRYTSTQVEWLRKEKLWE
ncbi:MAG: translation initiation factor eIF-1A [Candidatus Hadarchaeales archaeon]